MTPRPDAIFATADDLAAGICHALIAHGIEPGKDIKVVGFDGQPAHSSGDPTLTSVAVPLEELGRATALMAVERANEPDGVSRKLSLACRMRVGGTG